jgi:predicted ATP-grasp superfamily ATP-dependent carboligase
MSNLSKDILIAALILIGITGFISGEFIISSAIFALAVIGSNIKTNNLHKKVGQLTWV